MNFRLYFPGTHALPEAIYRMVRVHLIISLLFCIYNTSGAAIIFVQTTGNDSNMGDSWSEAYATLQMALSVASSGDEIWVAAGAYYPDEGPTQINNNSEESFFLKQGVSLYGGFAGTETLLVQRNIEANETILSGDIQQDGTPSNNSYHVVTANMISGPGSIMNGFSICGGYADFFSTIDLGGGLRIANSNDITVTRCQFKDNFALNNGGAIFIDSSSTVEFIACIFTQCTASSGGAVYIDNQSIADFKSCIFSGNTGISSGGAVAIKDAMASFQSSLFSGNNANTGAGCLLTSADVVFNNCTFSGNEAGAGGGALYLNNASPSFSNTIIWNNASFGKTDTTVAVVFNLGTAMPTWQHCIIANAFDEQGNWQTDYGVDQGNNLEENPLFLQDIDPLVSPQNGGDFRLSTCSPAIDTGDSTLIQIQLDAAQLDRITGDEIDLGAYEVQSMIRTWTGLGDAINWTDPRNWTFDRLPDACDEVIIPDGGTVLVGGMVTAVGRTLQIDQNAELEITLSSELHIEQP